MKREKPYVVATHYGFSTLCKYDVQLLYRCCIYPRKYQALSCHVTQRLSSGITRVQSDAVSTGVGDKIDSPISIFKSRTTEQIKYESGCVVRPVSLRGKQPKGLRSEVIAYLTTPGHCYRHRRHHRHRHHHPELNHGMATTCLKRS